MLIADLPNSPPENLPLLIAQADPSVTARGMRTIGVCKPAPNYGYDTGNGIDPKGEAWEYLLAFEHRRTDISAPAKITLLQGPKHGVLRPVVQADYGDLLRGGSEPPVNPADGFHFYLPPDNYFGKDKAVFLVEMAGVKIKVVYFFQAVGGDPDVEKYCGKRGRYWKISANLDADGRTSSVLIDAAQAVVSGLGLQTSIGFSDLPTATLAQTTGEGPNAAITFDPTVDGYDWFIDLTPGDNSEFVPTSNPKEWGAREGSAPPKMDMAPMAFAFPRY